MTTRPSFIGNYLDFLDEDNSHYPGSNELMSIGSAVGKKLGLKKIGIHIETIPPGRRTSWPHAESEEEEFGFVIEGTPHVWINGEIFPLVPGDFVALPSGTGIAHTFINNSPSPVKLLVGGEASKSTNKIIYPLHDSHNIVMKTKERLWENPPEHKMGSHDGLPDLLRSSGKSPKWDLPVLETKRLILRPLELSDADAIFGYASKPQVTEFVPWEPHQSIEDSLTYIREMQKGALLNQQIVLGITLKSNPQVVVGTVAAFWNTRPHKTMELGASIDDLYWGQGMVGEGLEALIDYCWANLEVERIQGRCIVGNTRSRRMMEKLGMQYEGILRSSFFAKGEMWDMEMFALIESK